MSHTQTMGVVPASAVVGVRDGACKQMGRACEALLQVSRAPGHQTHPEWYEPHFRRLDATRHLLDALGWGQTPEDVRLDFGRHADTLLAVVLSVLSRGEQDRPAARDALPALRDLAAELRLIQASQAGIASGTRTASHPRLTERQTEILSYLRVGATYAEIAAALHISVETVRTHARHLRRKFNVKASSELTGSSDVRQR